MGRCALNLALSKCNLSHEALELIVAGDLQNQCVATSVGLDSFGAPFLGIYGACSTCTEALLILSSMIESGTVSTGACVTTSHNSAAERQFRTPLEYGGQRSPSAQWTSTAAGSFILSSDPQLISESRFGSVDTLLPTTGTTPSSSAPPAPALMTLPSIPLPSPPAR